MSEHGAFVAVGADDYWDVFEVHETLHKEVPGVVGEFDAVDGGSPTGGSEERSLIIEDYGGGVRAGFSELILGEGFEAVDGVAGSNVENGVERALRDGQRLTVPKTESARIHHGSVEVLGAATSEAMKRMKIGVYELELRSDESGLSF